MRSGQDRNKRQVAHTIAKKMAKVSELKTIERRRGEVLPNQGEHDTSHAEITKYGWARTLCEGETPRGGKSIVTSAPGVFATG